MALVRLLLRGILFAAVWLAVMTVAHPASAEWAPLCDDRGASAFAPPPLLEAAPDVITRAARSSCDRDDSAPLSAVRRTHDRVRLTDSDGDAALLAAVLGVRAPPLGMANEASVEIERPHATVHARVERPPRN